jgi:cytochrome c peroxidase
MLPEPSSWELYEALLAFLFWLSVFVGLLFLALVTLIGGSIYRLPKEPPGHRSLLPVVFLLALLPHNAHGESLKIPPGLDLYLPVPEDNPLTAESIELGRRLFFDRRLSCDQSLSCASCHDPERAFSDGRPLAVGIFGRQGRRNAPALINRGYGRSFFWDGRVAMLEEQVLKPIQDPNEMDMSLAEAAARVGLPPDEISRALASFVRSILSGDSPYDRFINGDRSALTPEQQLGLQVFRGKGNCTACHVGPNFSDERLHNTGVAWRDGLLTDEGADHGNFKTPTLREIARTAPYMHDGSLSTLQDVVEFYDRGGHPNPNLDSEIRPLRLSPAEKQGLLDFLSTLSGRMQDGLMPRPSSTRLSAHGRR